MRTYTEGDSATADRGVGPSGNPQSQRLFTNRTNPGSDIISRDANTSGVKEVAKTQRRIIP